MAVVFKESLRNLEPNASLILAVPDFLRGGKGGTLIDSKHISGLNSRNDIGLCKSEKSGSRGFTLALVRLLVRSLCISFGTSLGRSIWQRRKVVKID